MRRTLLTLALAAAFLALAGTTQAGDDDAKRAGKKASSKRDGSKVAKRGQDHLPYKKTYADALLEARIRNLPVFVSRHKDF